MVSAPAPSSESPPSSALSLSFFPSPSRYARLLPFWLTLFFALVLSSLVLRSLLPRLPRYFVPQLRIRRLGFRGIRELEWRQTRRPGSGEGEGGGGSGNGGGRRGPVGLLVKIRRIHLVFHRPTPARRSWITVKVDGVRAVLPREPLRAPNDVRLWDGLHEREGADGRGADGARAGARAGSGARATQTAAAQGSPPLSPSPPPSTSAEFMTPEQAEDLHDVTPPPSFPVPLSLKLLLWPVRFVFVWALRTPIYFVATALPNLSHSIDLEISPMEAYEPTTQAVFRVENVHIAWGLQQEGPEVETIGEPDPVKLMEEKGIRRFLRSALPPGWAKLNVRIRGVKAFESELAAAVAAVSSSTTTDRRSGSGGQFSRPVRPSTAEGQAPHSPRPRQHGLSRSNSLFVPFDPSTLPASLPHRQPTLSRAKSHSDLAALMSPRAVAWASEQTTGPISESSVLLSVPDLSTASVSLRIGRSFTFRREEALDVSVRVPDVRVGLDAAERLLRRLEEQKKSSAGKAATTSSSSSQDAAAPGGAKVSKIQRQQPSGLAVPTTASSAEPSAPPRRANVLRLLNTFVFKMPLVELTYTTDALPSSAGAASRSPASSPIAPVTPSPAHLLVTSTLSGFHLELGTSDAEKNAVHRAWLGGGHKTSKGLEMERKERPGQADRGREPAGTGTAGSSTTTDTPRRRRPSILGSIKTRHHNRDASVQGDAGVLPGGSGRRRFADYRTFKLDTGFSHFDVVVTEGKAERRGSRYQPCRFEVKRSSVRLQSTWTPFGVLAWAGGQFHRSSWSGAGARPPPRWFAEDPNDQVIIAEATVDGVEGQARLDQLASLMTFIAFKRSDARPRSKMTGASSDAAESAVKPSSLVHNVPRLALALDVASTRFLLDTDVKAPAECVTGLSDGGSLLRHQYWFQTPRCALVFHGAYHDIVVRRDHQSKRAAYRNLRRDMDRDRLGVDTAAVGGRSTETPPSNNASPAPSTVGEDGLATTAASPSPARGSDRVMGRAEESPSNWEHGLSYSFETHFDIGVVDLHVTSIPSRGAAVSESPLLGLSHPHPFSPESATFFSSPIRDRADVPEVHELFLLRPFELVVNGDALGDVVHKNNLPALELDSAQADVRCTIENVDARLCRPDVLASLAQILGTLHTAAAAAGRERERRSQQTPASLPPPTLERPPLIDRLPSGLSVYLAVGRSTLHVAGSDPKCDSHISRGLAFETGSVVAQYSMQRAYSSRRAHPVKVSYAARSSLGLAEDVRVQANALSSQYGKAMAAKLSCLEAKVLPLLNANDSVGDVLVGSNTAVNRSETNEFSPAVWDFQKKSPPAREFPDAPRAAAPHDASEPILHSSAVHVDVVVLPPSRSSSESRGEPEVKISVGETERTSVHLNMLHIYCVLLAFSSARQIFPRRKSAPEKDGGDTSAPPGRRTFVEARLQVTDVYLHLGLPRDVRLFGHLRRLDAKASPDDGVIVQWKSLLFAGESSKLRRKWEEILRFRNWSVRVDPPPSDPARRPVVHVNGDGARLRIPHGFVVYRIVDNVSVAVKATKQLVHQFIKGKYDSVTQPHVEGPKKVPTIDFQIRTFTIEAQDDPIETKLNLIWRAGGEEQRARLEREAAFEVKVRAIRAAELAEGSPSISSINSSGVSLGPQSPPSPPGPSRREHVSARHNVSIEEAYETLQAFNASSWIRRHNNAKAEQGRREDALVRRIHGRYPVHRTPSHLPIDLLPLPRTSPLLRASFSQVSLKISPPSFPVENLPDFLHDLGKGTPRDMQYTLLVPLHISWRMSELRVELRDYPLPLLHVPPTHAEQPDDLKAFEVETDFVIAEQLGGVESIRTVPVSIVPAHCGRSGAMPYVIVVPKTALPVKTYAAPVIRINTSYPTRIGWGVSVQPAVHDVQRVIETITTPPADPSPRLGFWDKIRLVLQWRVKVLHVGDGDLHLHFKGTRDPYEILADGAGFVKVWRGNVEIRVGFDNPDREFFQISSNEYLLAVPDLKDYVDTAAAGLTSHSEQDSAKRDYDKSTKKRYRKQKFRKVVAKFTNGVRWGLGLQFERTCDDDTCATCDGTKFHRSCRFFDFKPHWEVVTRTRDYAKIEPGKMWDSYRGFRSDHLHCSISIVSPMDGIDGRRGGRVKDEGYNSLHFSPKAFTHFFSWWSLFSGAMSIPIRQGKLFKSTQPPSPKFGRHIATIKYRFSLSPLFVSHVYQLDSRSDWARGLTSLVGIKGKITNFQVDLHQRQQETVKHNPKVNRTSKVIHKPFYEAEVDCSIIDVRAICAQFEEPAKALVPSHSLGDEGHDSLFADSCPVADNDLEWADMDDFVELDWSLPERSPKLKILQCATSPRFTYYRRTHAQLINTSQAKIEPGSASGSYQAIERTKFGSEDTHTCLIGNADDGFRVQIKLARDRAQALKDEIVRLENLELADYKGKLESDQRRLASFDTGRSADIPEAFDLEARLTDLRKKLDLVRSYVVSLRRAEEEISRTHNSAPGHNPAEKLDSMSDPSHAMRSAYEDWQSFDSRYMAHNPTLFLNNSVRDVLLKYYHLSRRRKGFTYHMTAQAVKFIRELAKSSSTVDQRPGHERRDDLKSDQDQRSDSQASRDLLYSLFSNTEEDVADEHYVEPSQASTDEQAQMGISDGFSLAKSTVCILLKPQISLRSDVDDHSDVIITAIRACLKNYAVLDDSCPEDPVNSRVLHRNFVSLDGLQIFHPNQRHASRVTVPLETLVDLRYETRDFDRIVPRTEATMQYDKFNQLRLHNKMRPVANMDNYTKANEHLFHHMDLITVECPRFSVSANADHFSAIYNIVTNLLLYRDPKSREHSKKLERMLLMYDVTDLSALAGTVTKLQVRIRHGYDVQRQYELRFEHLTESERLDFMALKAEILDLSEELSLIIEAITTAQDQSEGGPDREKKSAMRLEARAHDIAWNMMGVEDGDLLAKLAIRGVGFTWLNKADNSTANSVSILDLQALNVTPNAIFPEIIAKHTKAPDHPMAQAGRFLDAVWNVLAPVGTVSIIDQFEFNLHPVRLQLELAVGRQIMEYLFLSRGERAEAARQRWAITDGQRLGGGGREDDSPSPTKSRTSSSLWGSRSDLTHGASSEVNLKDVDSQQTNRKDKWAPSLNVAQTPKWRGKPPYDSNNASLEMLSKSEQANSKAEEISQSSNRTFVYVKIIETVFCLSYKGEKDKAITNLYDVVFKSPTFEYHNKTWSYMDLVNQLKKDVFRSAWSQKGSLIKQVITHRPQKAVRALKSQPGRLRKARDAIASPLHLNIMPPTPRGSQSDAMLSPRPATAYLLGFPGNAPSSGSLPGEGQGAGFREGPPPTAPPGRQKFSPRSKRLGAIMKKFRRRSDADGETPLSPSHPHEDDETSFEYMVDEPQTALPMSLYANRQAARSSPSHLSFASDPAAQETRSPIPGVLRRGRSSSNASSSSSRSSESQLLSVPALHDDYFTSIVSSPASRSGRSSPNFHRPGVVRLPPPPRPPARSKSMSSAPR